MAGSAGFSHRVIEWMKRLAMPSRSVTSYYVRKLRRVLGGVPRLLSFVFASGLHAVGHALLALVAGAVALSLTNGLVAPGRAVVPVLHSALNPSSPASGDALSADKALFLSLVGLAVVVVKGAAGAYATFVQARVAGQVGSELRLELLDALLAIHRLHRPRQDDHGGDVGGTARGVAALTERVREVEGGLEQGFLGGARALAQLAPIAALLAVLSGRMALVATLVLGGFGAVLGGIRAGYRRASRRSALAREQLLEAADEAVRHADLWVTYGAEGRARGLVRRLGEAIAGGAARLQARAAVLSSVNEVLGALALVLAIAASRAGWLGRAPDGRTLFLFAIAFFLAYRPLREIAEARLSLARAQGAYDDLGTFIDRAADVRPVAVVDAEAARSWPVASVEVRSLRLARGAGASSGASLTLRIEAGTIAVLAGPTGIGKTTLLRTLLGLERPVSGEVLFDGEVLGDAPAGPASRPFAWVPQDAPLVADTLTANVALAAAEGDPRQPLDAMAALEAVSAAHLVAALGGERLGAGGRAVSGGERQWIALARAIATRQPVLLLDEPTSGLDGEAQRRVLSAIARLRGKRTVLLVTHRPEPMAIADLVVRFDAQGAIERAA
jgi:ABC-type multidrug transport system fused ATPase/permease subunit